MKHSPLLILACLLAGCQFAHFNEDEASHPEQAMGAGARVMYPGEGGPSLGSRPSASPAAVASSGSGSSSSNQTGSPPPAQASDLTMLGGTQTDKSGSTRTRQTPWIGPITALFGYPFWIFGKSVEEKVRDGVEKQRKADGSSPAPIAEPRTPDQLERARLAEENERMRRELARRAPSGPPAVQASGGPSTIADELAELERRLGGRSSPSPAGSVTGRPVSSLLPPREVIDRNADGRPDLWVYYDHGSLIREALDEDHDGRVDRILHYENGSTLRRIEEDLDGDERMDTTSIYTDGELSRKRSDRDGDGQADSWSFYEAGELIRHELDRNGDGFRDLILVYEAGELIEEKEDRNGDGRPDLLTRYRSGEIQERREDLDYDGISDVVSYYEEGKLVRRELTSEQLIDRWTD